MFHYKPSILGYPFWGHPVGSSCCTPGPPFQPPAKQISASTSPRFGMISQQNSQRITEIHLQSLEFSLYHSVLLVGLVWDSPFLHYKAWYNPQTNHQPGVLHTAHIISPIFGWPRPPSFSSTKSHKPSLATQSARSRLASCTRTEGLQLRPGIYAPWCWIY